MRDGFLTNYSKERFVDRLRNCIDKCTSFSFSVSFIKEAGLVLIKDSIENALRRGVHGKIITSTYQNFTDIPSLKQFLEWANKYENFQCHVDFESFGDNGFHSKGYLFEIDGKYEFLVGSTNITRFALIKNIEWNVSLTREINNDTIKEVINEFNYLWNKTIPVSEEIIKLYTIQISYAIEKWDMDYVTNYENKAAVPNAMQRRALKELRRYRDTGVKKALIIAATASGKTYLAAFDAKNYDAKRLLFIVHRDTILEDARRTFQNVFLSKRTYGMFTGQEKNIGADFIFATNTMMAEHLDYFDKNEFDYIVFDECHHVTASTYQKILNYFSCGFLLGLTATPERMDNQDVFEMFDKNVPYELRLRDAIRNDLVVPFHYFGVRDELVNYSSKDKSDFLNEYFKEGHIEFIAKQIEEHRPAGKLKAVAFCKSIIHAKEMAHAMSEMGYCTTSLTGQNLTGERLKAYSDLQDDTNPLEIIFTVDILNEGVDVPGINMVLFLRPTESQTIFIQQLGRGLRKHIGKDFLTVLDFIGNSYDRSIQIALGLGTLSQSSYIEKALLKQLIRDDFKALNLNNVEIHFDEFSKDEILKCIENTNFNRTDFLKQDYFNFKKYLCLEIPPKPMDFLVSDCAPDLMRFTKSKIGNKKNMSYYMFLKKIEEDVPSFDDEQINVLNKIDDMLPLTRREEFLILKSLIDGEEKDISELKNTKRITEITIKSAVNNLIKQKIVVKKDGKLSLNCSVINDTFIQWVEDSLEYGLQRYEVEFGDFEGAFKQYANYAKDKIILELDGEQKSYQSGTKYNTETGETYIFVGLRKDYSEKENFNYKDKFLSPYIFQWESVNNTTKENAEGKKLLNTKIVHLFVRKMESEDNITLPFTYFGTGKFSNCRESDNAGKPTLVFDVILDNPVPEELRFDFLVPEDESAEA